MKIEDLDQVIGVHVGNPICRLAPKVFPPDNHVGVHLLGRTLVLALQADGLTGEDCGGAMGGQLNDCMFLAAVTDRVAATETIKRELASSGLLQVIQIGFLEEDGWHCIYPSSEIRLNWLLDSDRLQFAADKVIQGIGDQFNRACDALKRIQEGKDQRGDKQ